MDKTNILEEENFHDPTIRSLMRNTIYLRSYQSDALRNIYEGVMRGEGERFTCTFPVSRGRTRHRRSWRAR